MKIKQNLQYIILSIVVLGLVFLSLNLEKKTSYDFDQEKSFQTLQQLDSLEQEDKLHIVFFYGNGCPHCKDAEPFLKDLQEKYNNQIKIHGLEVWYNQENADLMLEYTRKFDIAQAGVPMTIIGDSDYVIGFGSEQTTGKEIEQILENKFGIDSETEISKVLNIPFLGEVDLAKFSLPVLSIILGLLDGFNPCAMWVLVFLITLLLGMKDKLKMWILGGTFILTSSVIYFLFMSAWLNLFINIGYIIWIRIIIGCIAIFSGFFNLRDFFVNKTGECKVQDAKSKKSTMQKIQNVVSQQNFILAILGIILLAISVNMVELICSAGLPAIFTSVLAQSNLATVEYYSYLLIYMFFFMLDDVFVFVIAMITLKMAGLQGKFSRWSRLIGGAIILLLGILLLLAPQWLMFG